MTIEHAQRGWFRRFLRWFRGDDLDDLMGPGDGAAFTAEVADLPQEAVTATEADALSGTATAVMDPPLSGGGRRHFADGSGAPEAPDTVDENYILAQEGDSEDDVIVDDQEGAASDEAVFLTRTPARPEDRIIARVDEGVGEVVRVLANINTAVVQQNETVEGVARSLVDLPAAVRSQGVYLEAITRQLEAQNARSAELAGRLKDVPLIAKTLSEQGRAQLDFLQQLAESVRSDANRNADLTETVGHVRTLLESINEGSRAQIRALHELDRSERTALDVLRETAAVTAKRYAWLILLIGTLAAATVGGAALLAYLLMNRLPSVG